MSRLRYILTHFEFEIKHINGSDNVYSDTKSILIKNIKNPIDISISISLYFTINYS